MFRVIPASQWVVWAGFCGSKSSFHFLLRAVCLEDRFRSIGCIKDEGRPLASDFTGVACKPSWGADVVRCWYWASGEDPKRWIRYDLGRWARANRSKKCRKKRRRCWNQCMASVLGKAVFGKKSRAKVGTCVRAFVTSGIEAAWPYFRL